jgi:glutamine amidotransferase
LGQTKRENLSYHPVGDTDSEAVFCAILNALRCEFATVPTLPILHKFIKKACDEIIAGRDDDTIFNFLLGCGQYTMFAFSWPGKRPGSKVWNGLYYIVREPPFSTVNLIDCDYSIDFDRVTTPGDRVAVITTKPLTNEKGWKEFKRGELLMFDHGKPYSDPEMCASVEREGRGLLGNKCCLKMTAEQERRRNSAAYSMACNATKPSFTFAS